jgi:hypothetical protein
MKYNAFLFLLLLFLVIIIFSNIYEYFFKKNIFENMESNIWEFEESDHDLSQQIVKNIDFENSDVTIMFSCSINENTNIRLTRSIFTINNDFKIDVISKRNKEIEFFVFSKSLNHRTIIHKTDQTEKTIDFKFVIDNYKIDVYINNSKTQSLEIEKNEDKFDKLFNNTKIVIGNTILKNMKINNFKIVKMPQEKTSQTQEIVSGNTKLKNMKINNFKIGKMPQEKTSQTQEIVSGLSV